MKMKWTVCLYLLVSLFGAGLLFMRLNCHFKEQKFHLTLQNAAGSVWLSILLSQAARAFHQHILLMQEHLIFNALGSLFWAVMAACGLALARELGLFRRKASPQKPVSTPGGGRPVLGPNVLLFPQQTKSAAKFIRAVLAGAEAARL